MKRWARRIQGFLGWLPEECGGSGRAYLGGKAGHRNDRKSNLSKAVIVGLRERHTGRTRGIAITVRDYSGQLPDLRGRTLIFPLRQRVAEPCRAYPELFAVLGGQTPDMRGLFLRGYGAQTSSHYGSVVHQSGELGMIQAMPFET